MSRLERLKERKRKNKIKATACSLALSLIIGSVQGLGTYALFTDTEDISSNLSISTGDVDVAILDKNGNMSSKLEYILNSTDYLGQQPSEKNKTLETKTIKIKNQGTLKQNLQIRISVLSMKNESKNIHYKIKKSNGYDLIKETTFKSIYNDQGNLITADLGTLDPNQEIELKSIVSVHAPMSTMKGDRTVNYKFEVIATQLGKTTDVGFYDIYTQENSIVVKPQGILTQEAMEQENVELNDSNNSDVVEPSEPEVVEPPKEEIELPSEPEAVEPPKEEVELPIEPEIVEPPKEEVQVPIKSDIALPNQMDIIAQKKDEDLE